MQPSKTEQKDWYYQLGCSISDLRWVLSLTICNQVGEGVIT